MNSVMVIMAQRWYISSYLTTIYNAATSAGYPIGESNANWNFLTLATMNQAQQSLNSAAAAVAGNPTLSARVQRDSLPLELAWVLCNPALKQQQVIDNLPFDGPTNQVTACNSFISTAVEYNAGFMSEGQPLDSAGLLAQCRPVATVPSQCVGLTDWIDVPNNMFTIGYGPTVACITVDSTASTGYAAEMAGNTTDWCVTYNIPPWIANAGKWQCYVVVKYTGTATSGNAFQAGIYNNSAGTAVKTLTQTVQSAYNGLYETYSLGTQTLTTGMEFWFAPVNNSKVTDVYVDRIFMIEAN